MTTSGSNGNDHIYGTIGDDIILGLEGDDTLIGQGGADVLNGGAGHDWIEAGQGDATLTGGAGMDVFRLQMEPDPVTGEAQGFGHVTITDFNDGDALEIDAWAFPGEVFQGLTHMGNDTILQFGLPGTSSESTVTLQGYLLDPAAVSPMGGYFQLVADPAFVVSDDGLVGTADNDFLDGYAGNDTITGLEGDDTLLGSDGDDSLDGGAGHNILDGGAGNDSLTGGDEFDDLVGGTGDDILAGGDGPDIFRMEVFDDWQTGTFTGFGHDVITDFGLGDQLDVMGWAVPGPFFAGYTLAGNDTVLEFGTPGDDWYSTITLLNYQDPANYMDQGGAFFLYGDLSGLLSDDLIEGGAGNDWLEGFGGNDTLIGMEGDDSLTGGLGDDSLTGNAGNDWIEDDSGANTLEGGAGDDWLRGGDGDESLDGGAEADTLDGGAGNDTLITGDGPDAITFHMTEIFDENGVPTGEIQGFGHDTITDFSQDDWLEVTAWGYPGDILRMVEIQGNDTVLHFGTQGTSSDSSITLRDFHVTTDVIGWGSHLYLSGWDGEAVSDDLLVGTEADDWLDGQAGDDTIIGLDGDDMIYGGSGNDDLEAGAGDDILDGGAGDDLLTGGAGDDTFSAYSDWDPVTGEEVGFGHDTITDFGAGDSLDLSGVGEVTAEVIGSDTVIRMGAEGDPTASSVTLLNYAVDPAMISGWGHLWLMGEDMFVVRDDLLQGTEFDDQLDGFAGQDTLLGEGGMDGLNGGTGDDDLDGGAGDDWLNGDAGDDTLDGGDDMDWLNGGAGDDLLTGGAGDDTFNAYSDWDPVTGEEVGFGHDTITDFGAGDSLDLSGVGEVTAEVIGSDTVIRMGTEGDPTASSVTLLNYAVDPAMISGWGHLWLMGEAASMIRDDLIEGTEGHDLLEGFAGNDTLIGQGDHDALYGGTGDDSLDGGDGPDYLVGETGDDILLGGADADHLEGGAGNDTVAGGAGDDWIQLGTGNDQISGGAGLDVFAFHPTYDPDLGTSMGFGHDILTDFGAGDLLEIFADVYMSPTITHQGSDTVLTFWEGTDQFSTLTLQNYVMDPGMAFDPYYTTVTGDAASVVSDDLLTGDMWDDVLDGGAGQDTIDGAGGRDTLTGGSGDDLVLGGTGGDWISGDEGADSLDGGSEADWLDGGSGADTLDGGSGMDTLSGGAGDDLLTGGSERDMFQFTLLETGPGQFESFGHDTITDFGPGDELYVDAWGYGGDVLDLVEHVGDDTVLRFATGTSAESSVTLTDVHLDPAALAGGWDGLHYVDGV